MQGLLSAVLALGFLATPGLACAAKTASDVPHPEQAGRHRNVVDDPARDVYEHYPFGQVQPLLIEQPKIRRVMAEGAAAVYGGNVEGARLTALRVAYAEAVSQGSGLEIGRMSLIKNVKYVTQIVTSRSRGFIRDYRIIKEGLSKEQPASYKVLIEADVVDQGQAQGDDQYKALSAYLALLGNPKLLIILPERRIAQVGSANLATGAKDKTDVEFNQGDTRLRITRESSKNLERSNVAAPGAYQDSGDVMRSTEAALAQAFVRYGYQVVTSDDLLAQGLTTVEALDQARAGVTARAVEVARAAGADLALLGVLRVTEELVKPANVDLVMVTAEASAKALVVSSGKTIDVFHRTERASSPQMLKAYSDCLDKVAASIATGLVWEIPRILSDEYRETRLEVRGLDLRQSMSLQQALGGIEGVESVRVLQIPSDTNPVAVFVLMSGFVFVEPAEIIDRCADALGSRVRLVNANKFEIHCALERQ